MSDFDFDEIDKAVNSALSGQNTNDSSRTNEVNRELNVPTRGSDGLSTASTGRNLTSSQDSSETGSISLPPAADEDINAAVNSIVADATDSSQALGQTSNNPDDNQTEADGLGADEASKPGLPARRSGRFMDVVHPSSDMRTASMASRKPASISPLTVSSTDASLSDQDQPADETSTAIEPPAELESLKSIASEAAKPDNGLKPEDVPPPIDLDKPINTELTSQIDSLLTGDSVETPAVDSTAAPTPVTTPTPVPVTEAPVAASQSPVNNQPASQDSHNGLDFEETPDLSKATSPEPLSSPFIEGVAVNKRPLGSSDIVDEQPDSLESETSAPSIEAAPEVTGKKSGYSEELKHPDDVTARDVLPDELDNKLVSIESSTAGGNKTNGNEAKLDMSNETTGPTSIAKQYKEKVRTDNQDTSSDIFDTKNYHKPIKDEKHAKRISPLVIIFIIVFVILLIAASVLAAWWSGLFTLPF